MIQTLPHTDLSEALCRRLENNLPGRAAQSRFAPQHAYGRHFDPQPADCRQAAVMALFTPSGDWTITATKRPEHMTHHPGQVCLPGGMLEANESVFGGAMRETQEELGCNVKPENIVGQLSPLYIFNSNYWVTPVVAVTGERFEFVPSEEEVEQVVEIPVTELLDASNYGIHRHSHQGIEFQVPHIEINDQRIWGATGMILGELITVLREIQ